MFINFTDAKIEDLEVTGKRYVVWDRFGRSSVPGLCVIVEVKGKKTFYCVYSFCKRTRWLRIGPFPILSATEARIRAKKLLGEVADGRDPGAERSAKRGELTFERLQKKYVEEYAQRHNKSWRQGDYLIRAFVLDRLGKRKAADITIDDVSQLFYSIKAPQTANQTKAAISAVYKFAVKRRIVALNPCKGIDDHPTNARERILSAEDVPLFWAACDKVHPVKALALKVLLLCGQRPGEVCCMRREHIKNRWWRMPGLPVDELKWPGTKNDRTHWVWLSQPVQELIGEGTEGLVFANERGNPFGGLHDAMREISKLCDFNPEVTPRDLRRTLASKITGCGHGRDAMDRILNHYKKGIVTNTYDRNPYAEEDRLIMEDVARAIMGLVEGRKDDNVVAIQPGQRSAG
jgi:integrase